MAHGVDTMKTEKKLTIKKIAKLEAAVRAGCSRISTNDCGVNYRNG